MCSRVPAVVLRRCDGSLYFAVLRVVSHSFLYIQTWDCQWQHQQVTPRWFRWPFHRITHRNMRCTQHRFDLRIAKCTHVKTFEQTQFKHSNTLSVITACLKATCKQFGNHTHWSDHLFVVPLLNACPWTTNSSNWAQSKFNVSSIWRNAACMRAMSRRSVSPFEYIHNSACLMCAYILKRLVG